MPTIGLRLSATLRRYARPGRERETIERSVPSGTTIATLVTTLGIPEEEEFAAVVGNRIVSPDYVPQDGEIVSLLPPLVGG